MSKVGSLTRLKNIKIYIMLLLFEQIQSHVLKLKTSKYNIKYYRLSQILIYIYILSSEFYFIFE